MVRIGRPAQKSNIMPRQAARRTEVPDIIGISGLITPVCYFNSGPYRISGILAGFNGTRRRNRPFDQLVLLIVT
jgi:hypothetical protein